MRKQPGITSTLGVTLIAITVLAVGIGVYVVFQKTQKPMLIDFAITADDHFVVRQNIAGTVGMIVTSPDTAQDITLTSQSDSSLTVSIDPATIKAGGKAIATISGSRVINDVVVTIRASQANRSIDKDIHVQVIDGSTNGNSTGNANAQINKNTNAVNVNTGVPSDKLQFINKEFGLGMTYPAIWGKAIVPELTRLKPVTGKAVFSYFENFERFDFVGAPSLLANSMNYKPTESNGTPFWFSGSLDLSQPSDRIEQQVKESGLAPYEISQTKVDGRSALKIFNYHFYSNHFLNVTYIIPYPKNSRFEVLMITISLQEIANNEKSTDEATQMGLDVLKQFKAGDASDGVKRRFMQFEDAVASIQFTQ